jgi:hypothetical protein
MTTLASGLLWKYVIMKRYFLIMLALVFFSAQAGATGPGDVRDVIKRSYNVRPGGTLFIDLDQGLVEVLPRRGQEVLIEVELTVDVDDREEAKALIDQCRINFEQRGDDVHVEVRRDDGAGLRRPGGRWRGRQIAVRIIVHVPERYNLNASTGSGDVRAGNLQGRVHVRTGHGNIHLGSIRGTVDLTTGAGNVDVEGAQQLAKISTGAGNVTLGGVRGEVNVNTGAGNISAAITEQPEGGSRLRTGAGNVSVVLSPRIRLTVDATASVGAAYTDFPLEVHGRWMRKSFSGPINGGGPLLHMHAGVGNVTLRRR